MSRSDYLFRSITRSFSATLSLHLKCALKSNTFHTFAFVACRTCFQLRHVYEEAATRLDDEKPSVAMVAINLVEGKI